MPIFFFVSAIVAGLSMVIVESGLAHKAFRSQIDHEHHARADKLTLGLAKAASVVLFAYFFLKLQGLVDSGRSDLLLTGYGYWFLFEMFGFIAAPCALYVVAVRRQNATLARWVAGWTVLGVVVNRLNLSVITFNWNAAERYVPSAIEILISVTIVTIGVMTLPMDRQPHAGPARGPGVSAGSLGSRGINDGSRPDHDLLAQGGGVRPRLVLSPAVRPVLAPGEPEAARRGGWPR